MKIHLAVLIGAVVLAGCNKKVDELEKQNIELQAKNNELHQDVTSRDAYIENVTRSINDIYTNLETVRSKEKLLMKETAEMESAAKMTKEELRGKLLKEIAVIDSSLQENRLKIGDLQKKLSSYRAQFAGLKEMVNTLRKSLEEKEQSIAALEQRVQGLENELGEKTRLVSAKDAVINEQQAVLNNQKTRLTTAYYIVGPRKELEKKGIIRKEGGFLWGLLGSTTILANGFNTEYFQPINKVEEKTIQINGRIDEIIPKRNERFYTKTETGAQKSALKIVEPGSFWQDNYLVIITD